MMAQWPQRVQLIINEAFLEDIMIIITVITIFQVVFGNKLVNAEPTNGGFNFGF